MLAVAALVAAAVPAGAKATPSAADKVLLRAGVVTAADVPAGWLTGSQADTSADEFKGFGVCRVVYRAVFNAAATVPYQLSKAYSPAGADNGITIVDDTVLAFPTVARANTFVAAFQAPSGGPCLQAVLAKALKGEGHAVVVPLAVAPVADTAVGYEAMITSNGPGLSGPSVGTSSCSASGTCVVYVSTLNAAATGAAPGPGDRHRRRDAAPPGRRLTSVVAVPHHDVLLAGLVGHDRVPNPAEPGPLERAD